MSRKDLPPPLHTTRSTIIPLLGILAGVLVGLLATATGVSVAVAVLMGITAAAEVAAFLHYATDDKSSLK